jgi:hypothetical protein
MLSAVVRCRNITGHQNGERAFVQTNLLMQRPRLSVEHAGEASAFTLKALRMFAATTAAAC